MKKQNRIFKPLIDDSIDKIETLAGLAPKKSLFDSIIDNVAEKINDNRSEQHNSGRETDPESEKKRRIHRKFSMLHRKFGRPFARFVGDILDIILSGPLQTKIVNEIIEERFSGGSRKQPDEEAKFTVPPPSEVVEITIGGEPRQYLRNYIKRKSLLAALFLETDEYPAFERLLHQITVVCEAEIGEEPIASSQIERLQLLESLVESLRNEVNPRHVMSAWRLLEYDGFENLETIYISIRDMHLVRPTYYEDLDKTYREAKKLLKLLINEFASEKTKDEKQLAIIDYLNDILEVFTHHHFVLKFYNQTRPSVSRLEFDTIKRDLNERIEELRQNNASIRGELDRCRQERDTANAEIRNLETKLESFREKLKKLDPGEVRRQIQAMESKLKSVQKENQAIIEEDAELRTALRGLDEENQKLTQKLRMLHAIPDETAYSVDNLLCGKRVVVFGGVGRDHYWPLLKEAGVKESDYEWYEGYHTISLARTADIVGRCDLVVIITSYAGHLLLYQTRSCITSDQTLFLIHNSGAGSLRKHILQTFKKSA